jgi:sterol desaturase/sphingolipid hydroxylase (fatty acid hydroxylase superfamily)
MVDLIIYAIPAFVLLLALLGFAPWMILMQLAISLTYQFWIHTERIRKLPAPVEFFFNTPSHHRVHHGANEVYLDRNYGGILIVWDRIFGTFQGETERPRYGLTENIRTFRPTRVAFHEFVAIADDVRNAAGWRERLGFVFRGPGWSPDGRGGGTRG